MRCPFRLRTVHWNKPVQGRVSRCPQRAIQSVRWQRGAYSYLSGVKGIDTVIPCRL